MRQANLLPFSLVRWLLVIVSGYLFADDLDRRYQIEVFIFANTDSTAIYEEIWPPAPTLTYPLHLIVLNEYITAQNALEQALNQSQPYTMLPNSEHQLATAAQRILRQADFRLLFHQAWQQPLTDRKHAPSIVIEGGQCMDAHCELEGSIRLSAERYIHIDTDLWFTDLTYSSYGEDRAVTLKQHRVMRPGELHYIDHPLIGMLIKVTPVHM